MLLFVLPSGNAVDKNRITAVDIGPFRRDPSNTIDQFDVRVAIADAGWVIAATYETLSAALEIRDQVISSLS